MTTFSIGSAASRSRKPALGPAATAPTDHGGLVAGALPMLLILALSRWGSTIGIGSLYLTDLLIAAAVVNAALAYRRRTGPGLVGRGRLAALPPVFVLFLSYVIVRALLSIQNGPLLDWLRDSVPYFYGVLALLSSTSYLTAGARRRDRTASVFTGALIVHACWSAVMQLTPIGQTEVTVPFVGAPIFQPRPDIEAALNSIFAAVCLRAIIVHRYRLIAAVGLALVMIVVLAQGTRAGTLSLIVCLFTSFTLTYAGLGRLDGRRVLMTLAAPAVLVTAVIVLPLTQPGQRILATFFPDQVVSAAQQNAEGTAHARSLVWAGLIDWTESSSPRFVLGSGFGNDFLAQSNTRQYLTGADYKEASAGSTVRSPHDWFIGSFARIGLLGLVLQVGSLVTALAIIVRARTRIAQERLAFVSAMIVVAIIPVASLGVVLEAPFGAVPFFWALGIVYTFRSAPRQPAD